MSSLLQPRLWLNILYFIYTKYSTFYNFTSNAKAKNADTILEPWLRYSCN